MILNRRTFLKALGTIGLIPVLPSVKFAPSRYEIHTFEMNRVFSSPKEKE